MWYLELLVRKAFLQGIKVKPKNIIKVVKLSEIVSQGMTCIFLLYMLRSFTRTDLWLRLKRLIELSLMCATFPFRKRFHAHLRQLVVGNMTIFYHYCNHFLLSWSTICIFEHVMDIINKYITLCFTFYSF